MKKIIFILPVVALFLGLASCHNFGKEKTFNGVELYHTPNVTDAETDSLGNFLVSSKFADGTTKTVQITKSGNNYQFRFVAKAGVANDTSMVKTLKFFATVLSSQVFNGEHVDVHLCDNQLKTLKIFASSDYGKEKTFDGVQLYHTKSITDAEVDSLGKFLINSKFANGNDKSVQITKSGNTYQFRLVVKKGIDKDPAYLQNAKSYATDLSKLVFKDAPVEVHLCDDTFNTLAVVTMK